MQPRLMNALVLGHMRPASTASEANSRNVLLVASISKLGVQILLVRFLLAPLEFPKLANAQPSNFGPLCMLEFDVMLI